MAERDDIEIGRRILERGLLSQEKLLDGLFETIAERRGERARAFARPLGVLLLQRGVLGEPQLAELLAELFPSRKLHQRISEMALGEILICLGSAKRDLVQEALALQEMTARNGGPRPRLGEILVERGHITPENVSRALAYQLKEIYRCTRCAIRVNLRLAGSPAELVCQRCSGILVPAEAGAIGVHESRILPPRPPADPGKRGESGVPEETGQFTVPFTDARQAEIDRAVYVYARQKGLVRRHALREARRVQMEIARYGLNLKLTEVLRRTNAISPQQHSALEAVDFEAMIRQPDWVQQDVPGYRIVRKIADGGFGVIHIAQPVFAENRVALKVLRPERTDDATLARFRREAALLKRMDHPGIIRGIEYGYHQKTHYIVMEYFDGVSLAQAIAERRGFAPRFTLEVVRQVAEALGYLRHASYIHRDIKPDNILLGPSGQAKVCDLGFCAEIGGESVTPREVAVGTSGYMSPEQARGARDVGIATDIYALGITLFAMLAGFEPFKGASSEVMAAEYVEGGLPAPDLNLLKAPPPLIDLVRQMTHPDRDRRFSSYTDLLEALEKAAE